VAPTEKYDAQKHDTGMNKEGGDKQQAPVDKEPAMQEEPVDDNPFFQSIDVASPGGGLVDDADGDMDANRN